MERIMVNRMLKIFAVTLDNFYFTLTILVKVVREATKKKQEKKFTTVVNYGGVSKFWCVNLKKVLFLELIFQKTC